MIKSIIANTKEEWRAWLRKNHNKEDKVHLIRYKRTSGKRTFNSHEAMKEAICFGWIDTTVNRVDDEKYGQVFVKRTKNSRWSQNTIRYAKELINEGRMSKAGLEAYKKGLRRKLIDHGLSRNPQLPEDLKAELEKVKNAKENFSKFSPSVRRHYIWSVEIAVRPETRAKRIKEVVKRAKENRKPSE